VAEGGRQWHPGGMRGFVATAVTVLVAIGIGVGILAAIWSPPTYGTAALSARAGFPGTPEEVQVGTPYAHERAWVLHSEGTTYVLSVVTRTGTRLSVTDQVALSMKLDRRAGGNLGSGWVGYAPLQASGCAPGRGVTSMGAPGERIPRRRVAGHRVIETFVDGVRPEGQSAVASDCLGSLQVVAGRTELDAVALGNSSAVQAFIESVTPLGGGR